MLKINPRTWMSVSGVVLVAVVAILFSREPQWGIDFTGGSLLEVSAPAEVGQEELLGAVSEILSQDVSVQETRIDGERMWLLRAQDLPEEEHQRLISELKERELVLEELRFESIGPTIGEELKRKAVWAILAAIGVMVAYLAYTFRDARGRIASWKFGVAAAVALVHDVALVMTVFVLIGAPIDTLFVTAMLAIIGYSVNDTIVLFDRLKREWQLSKSADLKQMINLAATKTLRRSLNTSLTTLLVLAALAVLGGESIRWFVVALMLGTIVGTYSSMFVAPPVLYFLGRQKK